MWPLAGPQRGAGWPRRLAAPPNPDGGKVPASALLRRSYELRYATRWVLDTQGSPQAVPERVAVGSSRLAALYAALSDEQKKKADQILTGMGCMM